jgi:hypothetical protein
VSPFFTYRHDSPIAGDGRCAAGSSAISGLAFEQGSDFPAAFDGALVVADYGRDCIFVLRAGRDGRPDPSSPEILVAGAANPVDVVFGPDGALYYVDFDGGTIRRVAYDESRDSAPPTVALTRPADGARVSRTIVVEAEAAGDAAVVGVQFRVDGVGLGRDDAVPPYRLDWDTTTVRDGQHTLVAVARDEAGNSITSAAVTVTVDNRRRFWPRLESAWHEIGLQLELLLDLLHIL